MWKYNEYLSNVQKVLKELGGICQRCVLRFGGVKSSREHRNITIEDNLMPKPDKEAADFLVRTYLIVIHRISGIKQKYVKYINA